MKETKIEKAFKAMDANGDGFVTRAEFKKACKALKPEQVQMCTPIVTPFGPDQSVTVGKRHYSHAYLL